MNAVRSAGGGGGGNNYKLDKGKDSFYSILLF
jgi:hypothetical protein